MIEKSLRSSIKSTNGNVTQIVYHLIFKNAFFSIECYEQGYNEKNKYSYLENITDDEGEAEAFMKLMSNGKVHPIHIRDIAEDYFN